MTRAIDAVLLALLKSHCASFGSNFTLVRPNQVKAEPSGHRLFAKIESSTQQILGEAYSLDAMEKASKEAGHHESLIPAIHAFGEATDGRAYLITDYRDLSGRLDSKGQAALGKKLAEMHIAGTSDNAQFGFDRPTFCGVTKQDNTWSPSWGAFWADRRIGSIVERIGDTRISQLEAKMRRSVYPLLFDTLSVTPAILHGDLWSGNVGADAQTGQPVIFDPSSYYGHAEAELGIMKMFGGFGPSFFQAYHEVLPQSAPYYEERLRCYELYHHLNHALMFGGGYRAGAIAIMEDLISWAEHVNVASRKSEL